MYPTVVQFNIMKALTGLTTVKYVLMSISDNRKTPTVTETTTSICFNNGSEKAYVLLIDQNKHVSIVSILTADGFGQRSPIHCVTFGYPCIL